MTSSKLNGDDNVVLTLNDEEAKALFILLGNMSTDELKVHGLTDDQAEMVCRIWHSLA